MICVMEGETCKSSRDLDETWAGRPSDEDESRCQVSFNFIIIVRRPVSVSTLS
jgi:hypothetical protein